MTYPPCILTHNPLAFKLAEEQIYKCLPVHSKYSEFGRYSFLSFFLTSYTNLLSQNDSSKLQSVFKIPLFGATTKVLLSFIGNEESLPM